MLLSGSIVGHDGFDIRSKVVGVAEPERTFAVGVGFVALLVRRGFGTETAR